MATKTEVKTAPRNEAGQELWLKIAARALIFAAEHLIRMKIEGTENLREAADYVNSDQGGLLVTPNHNSYIDALLMDQVRKEVNPLKRFVVLWANKFTGKDQGKYAETGQENMSRVLAAGKIGQEAARKVNIELIAVPQEATDIASARKAVKFLELIGEEVLGNDNVLGVFPEGTRSRNGKLGEAKKALKYLFESPAVTDKTLILPIAITGTDQYLPPDKEKLNPLAKVSIIYGKPYTYAQAKEEMKMFKLPLGDIMMWHIGRLLPKEKWGVYEEFFSTIQNAQEKSTVRALTDPLNTKI
ncbi:1-acyl-sn-glycerol-3-phosphate acyltransferase [bacterium]|nr:MAG: 1-acyl-sn-glycerol-3-phosphate acyltransferase [bacterium]